MAGNTYGGRNGSRNNGGQGRPGNAGGQFRPENRNVPIVGEPLPANWLDLAEQVILELSNGKTVTTSKLRNLFSIVTDIYNAESIRNENTLLDDSVTKLTEFRIRVAYEAGRDPQMTKVFVEKTKILNYAKTLGNDRKKFIDFYHYMEALVAYHRFYIGGKEG